MDLPDYDRNGNQTEISEKEIVYLADKCVMGTEFASPEKRFDFAMKRFGNDPDAQKHILVRKEKAIEIRKRIENLLDMSVDDLLGLKSGQF